MGAPILAVSALLLLLARPALAQRVDVTADGKRQTWQLLHKADQPWRICALLPHGRDKYWWGVSWGLAEQARQLGVQVGIYAASSYADLPMQKQQWAQCEAAGAQAFVLAAIHADAFGAEVARARAAGKPVIDLINGVSAETTSRATVSFADMAALAAEALLRDAGGQRVKVAWFPGPADAAWVRDGERGLLHALAGKPIELSQGGHGPTDARTQATLVRSHVAASGVPDYLVGNAVAVEFAARYFSQRGGPQPRLLAYYATEEVVARIASGEVVAAPSDQPILQARIALDLAVRALQQQAVPRRVSPNILMLDRQSLQAADLTRLLPPKGQWMVQQPLPPGPAAAPR